jgi:hypothetical protein
MSDITAEAPRRCCVRLQRGDADPDCVLVAGRYTLLINTECQFGRGMGARADTGTLAYSEPSLRAR